MTDAGNPLRLVHEKFWDLLENSTQFTTLVPVNNRIKYKGGLVFPEKSEIQYGDTPEVVVRQTGFLPYQYQDSAESTLVLRFSIDVTTIEQKIETLLDVQWAIYCAMLMWDTSLETLTWNGYPFVKQCRSLEASTALGNVDNSRSVSEADRLSRGHGGWTSVWSGEIHCRFNNAILRGLS